MKTGHCCASGTGNWYNEANPDPLRPFLWIQSILNLSQMWALYCLMYVYKALREPPAPISPAWKFFCIKMVVFFTFWQEFAFFFIFKFWPFDLCNEDLCDGSGSQAADNEFACRLCEEEKNSREGNGPEIYVLVRLVLHRFPLLSP